MVGDAEQCKAASDLLLRRHDIYIQPINYPTVADRHGAAAHHADAAPHRGACVDLVEALVDVWKALGLPFTTARIMPLRRQAPAGECVYPEMRKAAE